MSNRSVVERLEELIERDKQWPYPREDADVPWVLNACADALVAVLREYDAFYNTDVNQDEGALVSAVGALERALDAALGSQP